jgi:hypothetical protein
VLAVVGVLAACQPAQERTSQAAQPRRAPAAAAVEAPAAYPIATVDRLRIVLPFTGRALREPRIDVKAPHGRLYAQLPVTVETDAAGGGTATAVLEVRGTNIDGYRMVGTWRFVLVDGAGPPLATQAIDLH